VTVIRADVAVVGAGSAGCIAAIAAGRAGLRTVLLDRLGAPGGTSTAVLDTFYAFFTAGAPARKVVQGLPDEPVARLRERGVLRERPNSFGSGTGYTYDPETLKLVWAELLAEAGVTVALHSMLVGADVQDGAVRAVTVATRAGLIQIEAAAFVDASGDADLIARAGGRMLNDDARRQPATTTFRMASVDIGVFQAEGRPHFRTLVEQARTDGFRLAGSSGSLHASGQPGVALMAVTRIPSPDLDDPLAAGRLELQGLEQVDEWTRFLRLRVPGFESAVLVAIGAMAGVRETRRIHGRHVLTEAEVLAGASFPDQVALCGAPIEDLASDETRWVHVGGTGVYGVPWRTLVPESLRSVVVAGRCLSATHGAHASARSMATCMAMGEAAGRAAMLAAERGIDITDVDGAELRSVLRAAGAGVDHAA
jgi:glycine/D-amino acid oxidase-like deaminating enzyme